MARRVPIEKRVAERVRQLREQQGLSQAALAKLARTHRSQVAAIERGDRAPTVATAEQFARALGVTVAELVADADERPTGAAAIRAGRLAAELARRGTKYIDAIEGLLASVERVAEAGRRSPP